jgi:hypothetical protein
MPESRFVLQFDVSEIPGMAARYVADDQGVDDAALRAGRGISAGDYSRDNLQTIFRWKTGGRGMSRLERNTDDEIADALQLAVRAAADRSAVAVLCGLNGVAVPVASAILTAINPERFTIIDFRALESLGVTDRQAYYTIDFFIHYLRFCRRLANECRVGLRTLDRALWQWSKEKSKAKS